MTGHDVKREQIREAARRLFLAQGYAATSTGQVAKAAGVSKETLYSRYSGKQALLADVLESLITLRSSQPEPALAAPRTIAELRELLTAQAQGLLTELTRPDYLALARIVIAEKARLPEVGELFRASVPERALGLVEPVLGQAQRAGLVREVDPAAAARLFAGPLIVHLLMNHLLTDPDETRPFGRFDVSGHVDLFLAAVRRSPRRRKTT